jgi:hypothetical protein
VGIASLLQSLLGIWICEQASPNPRSPPTLGETLERVGHRLQANAAQGTLDLFQYDSKLVLLCHRILVANGVHVPVLEAFARQVGAALEQLAVVPLRYAGEAALLSDLGYCRLPPATTLSDEEAGGGTLPVLRANEDRIRVVCANVAAATQFGRHPLQAPSGAVAGLQRVLPLVLLQSLRQYRLETGATVLRVIGYVGAPETHALTIAIEFLLLQQQGDGHIGYLATESKALAERSECGPLDPIPDLYVPVTVSCVWALAERLLPDYRLFSPLSVPRSA